MILYACSLYLYYASFLVRLPFVIDPLKAANAFRSQREALKLVLQHNLPSIADKLYSKHIISAATLAEAMNQVHIASVRTVSLLSVVEDKIRAEPHVFTEFIKILESEPTLRSQAKELMTKYFKEGTAKSVSYLSTVPI